MFALQMRNIEILFNCNLIACHDYQIIRMIERVEISSRDFVYVVKI